MSIRTDLRSALEAPIAELITEFGSVGSFRREYDNGQTADGEDDMVWQTPMGGHGVPIILEVLSRSDAEKFFGRETTSSVRGLVSTGEFVPQVRDGLRVIDGGYDGRRYRVQGVVVSDLGTVAMLELEETQETFDGP